MKIDAHHHFWKYSSAEYGWIDDSMARIRRDFLPSELQATIQKAGIDAVVSVQARQTEEESSWLLALAEANPFIAGVVGWIPLSSPAAEASLERHAANPKLRAVRHVLQGEPEGTMLAGDFNRGLSLLKAHNLAYDILIFERQLSEAIQLVDWHPDQRFILDHIAKPRIRERLREPWLSKMKELARRPNVWCKLSGLVTEADFSAWTEQDLLPYLEGALEAFGSSRLMFGSDWPVCLTLCEYARWKDIVERFVSRLRPDEQERFWHRNAAEAYNLKLPTPLSNQSSCVH